VRLLGTHWHRLQCAHKCAQTRRKVHHSAKEGFEQVTVDQLATEAGVWSPTIFVLFQSKAGIVKALMQAALFNDRYDELVQKAMASDDPVERIRMAAAIARTVHDGAKAQTGLLRGASAFSRELKSIERAGEQQRFERQEPTILLFRKRWPRAASTCNERTTYCGRSPAAICIECWSLNAIGL
jgi:AcrR family transcriptional regulator